MKPLSDTDASYIAGIIDGEGSIAVNKSVQLKLAHGLCFRPEIRVAMTDRAIIEWLKETTGVGKVYNRKISNPKHRQAFLWAVCGHDASDFAESIVTRLRIKYPQALNLMCLCQTRRITKYGRGSKKTNEQWEREFMFHQISRSFNSNGKKSMPDGIWGEP